MGRVKIPATFRDDEELFERIAGRYGEKGWVIIPNTLHLETLYASEDLRGELAANPICTIDPEPVELHSGRPASTGVLARRTAALHSTLPSTSDKSSRHSTIAVMKV